MRTIRDETSGDNAVSLGDARAVRETDKALLIELSDGDEIWVPKSVVHDNSEVFSCRVDEDCGKLFVLRWWAEKQGLT